MRSLKEKRRLIIALTALAIIFVCGFVSLSFNSNLSSRNAEYQNLTMDRVPSTPQPTMMAMPTAAAYAGDIANQSEATSVAYAQTGGSQSTDYELQPGERVVIRNATMGIAVEDTEARVNEISSMATGLGGWVVSSSTSVSGGTPEDPLVYGNISIRVPAESLDAALESIRAMAMIVSSEQITGQDVTQDFVDTSSQLRNLEAAELQLQGIMLSAESVDEVLSVYNQLVQTRSDIEIARGRLEYYSQAAAFSSITVSLTPYLAPITPTPTPVPVTVGWNPLVTVNRALDSLVRTSQNWFDLLITWGVYALPIGLVFGLPTFLFVRQWKKQRSNKRVTITRSESSVSEGES
jgi:hypothetical protein